ncbi:MAG: NAD(P)-dependent alcohol dehydrogenase [Verrucomicrobiales bacterium]|nr:NAD(P)-dependent alcohol dehydrogenase [Verrucomicrobiales bacterium]
MRKYILKTEGENSKPTLALEECELPKPQPGEVLVNIRACSLNYRDLLVKSGKSASGGDGPVVPLSDGAGEITAVGAGVSQWKEGDRVALTFFQDWEDGPFEMKYHKAARGGSCDGVLAEYVAVPENSVVAIPEYMSYNEAATLPCAAVTAWHALFERGRPFPDGGSLLCLGTGGVSIIALQIAAAAGGKVYITSSSDDKIGRAMDLGATNGINYKTTPDWDKAIFEITGKQGVNQVMEVGGPGTFGKSMNAVGAGGTISMIGVLTGFDPTPVGLFPLVARAVDVNGIYVGSRAMFERMNHFLTEHKIRPVIDKVFSFEDVEVAYDCLENAGHFGKIVIELEGPPHV